MTRSKVGWFFLSLFANAWFGYAVASSCLWVIHKHGVENGFAQSALGLVWVLGLLAYIKAWNR